MRNTIKSRTISTQPHSSCEALRRTICLFRLWRLFFLNLVLCCGLHVEALAQNVQYTNKAVDLGMRSTQRVNPTTRGAEFQIPLGQYRGRGGLDVPVILSYSSKLWGVEYQGYNPGAPPPHGGMDPFTIVTAEYAKHSVAGWTSSVGFPVTDFTPGNRIYDASGNPNATGNCTAGCYVVDRMMVWMPDGSGHELRASDQPRLTTQPAPDNLYSVDGSRMRYQKSSSTLFMPDGSQYKLAAGKYVDRNGNTLTWVGGWRDTLDRTINNPLPYNQGQGPLSPVDQTYTLPGVANSSITYTLKWRNLADVLTTPEPVRYIADGGCPPGSAFTPYLFQSDFSSRTCIGNAGVVFNPVVLSQIVLPNGQTYTFTYDIFGAINKVVLPTGGYEKFEYAYVPPVSSPINFKFVYAQGNRGVTRRLVSPSGLVADEAEWLFSGGGNFVSVTGPDDTRSESYLWTDGVSGWGYSADSSRAGLAFDERIYAASGQMLRRKLTDWVMTPSNASGNPPGTQAANRNARIAREVELILDTSGSALAKSKTYNYDLSYQYDVGVERTVVSEFAYVNDQTTAQTLPIGSIGSIPNGTLLRSIEFDYLTSNANYRSRNLLGLVTATRVKNGGGTIVTQSSNIYDEPAYPLLTYTSVVGWTDPATTYRGNVTTVRGWLNFNGSTLFAFPAGPYLSTHIQYDQCGSVRKTWDALDTSLTNPTQVEYSSTYHRAYPTLQTSSDPDGGGPLTSLIMSTEYDLSTGLVTAVIDANSQRTSFAYNDPLNRLRQTIRAETDASAKSQTTYLYDDLARTVTTTTDLNSYNDNALKTVTVYDGLGRLVETRQYEGPSSYITVEQQYDALGRAFKSSNPFRPSQGESALWTTQQFDALGRSLSLTTPDSAVSTTSYSGSTVTVTDQSGKKRKTVTDSLGRLTQVIEAPNVPGYDYLTEYQYDALDNLVKVTQGGQFRYFMHDSLKRLVRSRNPEQGINTALNLTDPVTLNPSWSTAFQYDNNGNLTQKTDARGIVSTYVYDALNRNTTINYSDTAINPDITRTYDGATKGKGRLWQSYAGGTETAGSTVEHVKIQSYDELGRPKDQRQRFKTSSAWSGEYQTQRTYNRAGLVKSQTYPSGRTISYNYDNAGRVADKDAQNLAFTGNLGDGVQRTYAKANTYSPFGGLRTEQFGTTTPLYHKLKYNIRGQLYSIALSSVNDDANWNRGAIVNYYSFQPYGFGTSGPDNNGNLLVQQHWVPNDDAISGSSFMQQNYGYDALNRLDWVGEYQDGTTGTGSQSFSYDRWGNRTISAASGTGINDKQFTVNTANNRLGVPAGQSGTMTYDAAGNLTTDTYSGSAVTRVYDTENRMTSETQAGGLVAGVYTYNADGQRVRRKVSGVETWQIYGFDGELLAEYAASAVPGSPQREYGYRNGQLLITAAAPAITNVALSANGATATASSTLDSGRLPIAAINGDRKGLHWGSDPATGSGWHCATNGVYPDWLQVDFNGSKTIDEINVITLQDNYGSPAEPTETMTFGTYGITAFDVQYWNGSAWVTIPNGSVTGNNKVWRKFTFSSITTSKIRVLVNNALAGYSRIVEVEAWSTAGGGGTSDIKWLVADHLGTPRIIADKTGSLAGIKRHDYLPFGEELFTGTGGRTIAKGYSGDGVRQKFTRKERDNETGLDYFGARYYASIQGRFTSVDPSGKSIVTSNPQSWNRYSYTLNNPLVYIDQNGKWPTRIHNRIIDLAFQGLSKTQRAVIKKGSWSVDDPKNGGFALDKVHRHGLRRPGQSTADAAKETHEEISGWQRCARESSGNDALEAFGKAFHTVSDMTSPAHEGYQVWRDVTDNAAMNPAFGLGDWLGHALSESELGFDFYRQGFAVGATLKLYGETFDQDALNQATGGVEFGSEDDPTVQQIRRMSLVSRGAGHIGEGERLYQYRLGLTRGSNLNY